ncbi:glycosyltransferase family 1 protein [Geodermatophilus sp. Leaf369]|uniref:glycosyltransferase family 4 protein n=1 Tax=Geodermatophilus sp. Leaf369 TaxID=1736354 RepID=UPI00210189D1|nr:glycosyltransferase family 1 protein [Geodermatophilus sp. Leaf369]
MGRYVDGLVDGLAGMPDGPETLLTLFSLRGQVPLPPTEQIHPAPRRLPARLLRQAWARSSWPPAEMLTGRVDVFHGTNFMVPPTQRAAGVLTVHDLAYLRFPDTVTGDAVHYRSLVPRALDRGVHVIAVTQAMADEITDTYRLSPERVSVAHHGVDPSWGSARAPDVHLRDRLGLPDRYLVFAGNLEPRKNLGVLVRAHHAARCQSSSVPPLVLIGPAGWGDRWQGDPPDARDVLLPGYLAEADLQAVVAGATALCMPSTYEGFGLPVVEAMATGVPVIASDIPAHREVGGDQFLRIDAHDTDAWAHALLHPELSPGTATSRRERASTFTWSASAADHVNAYVTAVRAHRS